MRPRSAASLGRDRFDGLGPAALSPLETGGERARSAGSLRWPRSLAAFPTDALAHASDRGHVLLLPTGHYLVGGALAVAASFLVLLFVRPEAAGAAVARRAAASARVGEALRLPLSLLSFVLLAVLVAAGFLRQPRPAVQSAAADRLDAALGRADPGPGPVRQSLGLDQSLVRAVAGRVGAVRQIAVATRRRCELPPWLGMWPAVLLFLGFAWFELVYPAPDDPARLAWRGRPLLAVQLRA